VLAPLNLLESGLCLAYHHKLDLYNFTSDGQDNRASNINSFIVSAETRYKLSIIHKGKTTSLEAKTKMAQYYYWPIKLYDNGIYIATFDNVSSVARYLNKNKGVLSDVIKRNRIYLKRYSFIREPK
jgi:hypothetical protein